MIGGKMKKQPGDELRDRAAKLLEARYGVAKTEQRVSGKKVDVFFEIENFGKKSRLYVEAKDYARKLHRSEVVTIWADYMGIVQANAPASLLIVTREGLSTDADMYVTEEQSALLHQKIRQIENDALGIDRYVEASAELFEQDGLSEYYIPARASEVSYSADGTRSVSAEEQDIFDELVDWISGSNSQPYAILAGYGAGKSSLARRLMAYQCAKAIEHPSERRPILIRLGGLTRYSSIEGLLGGMFTSEFPTPNFNFHTFDKLNREGRLLIILDGFDEMKHAMSWSDFKNQLRDLNRLAKADSRVLLLGRPTAFLSLDEHLMVLRGIRRFGEQFTKDLDWPTFSEFELCPFTEAETSEFIRRYLKYKLADVSNIDEIKVSARIGEVNKIAAHGRDLFSKPVHLKMLVDLAADTSVDLSRFAAGLTRWDLYELFFRDLTDREVGKEARRPVSSDDRMAFLTSLAFWLWNSKDGRTSFQSDEVPSELLPGSQEAALDDAVALREYLTGAFLEKKDGETFFFGHRSFAEYLVACYLVGQAPTGRLFETYSNLSRDGVAQFLADYPDRHVFELWVDEMHTARGVINLEFLVFLQLRIGESRDLRNDLPKNTAMKEIYRAFVPNTRELLEGHIPVADEDFETRIRNSLLNCESTIFAEVADFFTAFMQVRDDRAHAAIASFLAGTMLERVFRVSEQDSSARKTFVGPEVDIDRRIATASLSRISEEADDRFIRFFWEPVLDWGRSEALGQRTVHMTTRSRDEGYAVPVEIRLRWSKVLDWVGSETREAVRNHFRMSNSLEDVVTISARKPRRKIQSP